MVVVLDCRGASSMGMTRHMGLLKRFALTMTQHYPVCGWRGRGGVRMRVGDGPGGGWEAGR